MAAAPADFTPAEPSRTKIKKSGDGGLDVDLARPPTYWPPGRRPHRPTAGDRRVRGRDRRDPDELLELGRAKLARKGCDLLVLNEVGGGGVRSARTTGHHLDGPEPVGPSAGSKDLLAHRIWDEALAARDRG